MRGRGLLFGALLCAGCLSAVASQALFVREESLAQLRDTRSTSSQTSNFNNNNNNSNNNNFDNHSSRSGRSGANGSRRTSSRRAPVSPDSLQQPQQQQDRSNPPPWDLSHHSTSRRRPTGPSQDSNGGDQDFLKTSQSQYPRQQYNQQYNNNFNQKASQYQKPQNQAFQKTASKSHDYDDLSNDQYNAQAQFSQNTFSQQNNQFNNNNFNRNQPTGNNQFGGGNQFGNQQTSNNFNNDARVNNQPRGSNFNTDGGRAATHFESTRNQFRQGRQFQNGSNQKPQQQAGRQDQSQQPFRQEHEQPLRQQHNQQPFRQQQQSRQSQNKQSFRQDQTQQPVRQDQSFRQDQNHQPSRQDQNQFNNFNGFNNNNNNQGLHDNNFNNNHFHQQSSTSQRSRTPQQNANFNSFNSVNNNFNKIKSHNNDDNDIHRLSPTTPPNNNNYVIFPTGSDDQIPFNNQGVNNNNNNNIQQPFQRQPVAQQEQPRAPVTLTGQRNVQPQSDPTRESQPNNRAARVPSQPHSTVSIDQTVQSILNWIQGMSRAQERRARQQGVGQPSRQYLPVPEATERPRPFQPAVNPPTEPARQQGVTPPSRQYLPVPESPATEAPRPFETPAPEAPTTGPADTPYETPAPGGPVPTGPEQPTGPGPEPAPGPEPVPIPIPETPSPELETPSPATEPAPTEVPFTEAPATPAPTETPTPAEYPTPAAPQETPAPETPPPEVYTEAPATPAPEVQTEAPTPAPEAPLPEAPAPEAPAETPAPEAPVYTPAPEYPTEAPTIAPEAPAPEAPAPEVPAPEAPAPTAPEQPAPVPTGPATATPVDDGLHPPHIHAIDVQCAKDMMTITIEFDKPYDGIIYSKGFYKDANCRYVQPNSNQIKYTFTVMLNSCGTQFVDDFQGGSGQAYLENVIVLQNEEGIQEVWDSIRSVRCLWEGNLKQALTVALSVGNLNQEIVTFGGDTGMAKLDIQVGRGPFAPTANGLVKIGEMMTLVVTVEGDPGFDVQVRACVARDADSTNLVPLTDNDGCVLKPKLLGAFQKTKDTGNTGASIIAYAFFQAFKFPDVMDLIIECSVDLCKTDCEMCPNPNQKLEPGARRRRRDVWSAGNATRAALRNAEVDSEGLVGDDLGVVMGRRLRVFTPDELPTDLVLEGFNATALQHETYGDNVIHVTSDPSREDAVCMSVPSFAASSALMLSLLTGSCLLSATLWLKLQRSVLGKQKQRSLAHALVTQ